MLPRKRLVLFVTGALLAAGIAVSFLLIRFTIDGDDSGRVVFDQTAWLAGDTRDANPQRTQMVDDLLRRIDFHGKTRAEVQAVLGEPTDTAYFADWDMVYWLGPERGMFSIDDEWLLFKLDQKSTVLDYRIVTD